MNFFERQAAVRRTSRYWVILFVIAVFAIVAAVDTVAVTVVSLYRQQQAEQYGETSSGDLSGPLIWSTLIVLAVIVLASLYKSSVLSAGGSAVAKAAGGRRVFSNTQDAGERKLLNIVEEMAIASGVPVPEVYVLEQEDAINAFAAGHAPANAAIAVTRGALDTLTRSELQGVIAHEFSHLLNGDMRLNIRLMGLLFGILVIALVGQTVLRFGPRSGGKKGGGAAAIMLTALAIMIIGYVGLFFGRLIQAAVSRNREALADASAVQFTRDPLGLRGALVKIGAAANGSRLRVAQADEIAHMLFAPGMKRFFATHPPLIARLQAIDPSFREAEFGAMRLKLARESESTSIQAESPAESSRDRLDRMIGGGVAVAPAAIAQLVGNPSPVHMATAHAIFASLPEDIVQAGAEIAPARALFLALALDETPDAQSRQLKFIGVQLGLDVSALVEQWLPKVAQLNPAQRQPALLRLLPALRQLSTAERSRLLICLTGLLQREGGNLAIEKYALRKLAQLHLRESITPPSFPGKATLQVHAEELSLLFSVLAIAGTSDLQAARFAYEAGMSTALPRDRPAFSAPAGWPAKLDAALNKLDRLLPAAKEILTEALVKTISHDGKLTVQEAELLRAICATLHCPLPPLVGQTETPPPAA